MAKSILSSLVKRFSLMVSVGGLAAALSVPNAVYAAEDPYFVGYFPAWRVFDADVAVTKYSQLTHIHLAFINPNENGVFIENDALTCMDNIAGNPYSTTELQTVVDGIHSIGVKAVLSVGGGSIPACNNGSWQTLLQSQTSRQTVINNLISLVETYGFDGLDIDIENTLLAQTVTDGTYTPFIQELKTALSGKNIVLSAATASYEGGRVPVESLSSFDYLMIMSYDAVGPSWGEAGGEHSTYAAAEADIATWKGLGLPADKLVLGIPFYGIAFGSYAPPTYISFNDILQNYGANYSSVDTVDTACDGCSYISYNGTATVKLKTKLALDEGAGVMLWEIGQDTDGENSLSKAIGDEIALLTATPTPEPTVTPSMTPTPTAAPTSTPEATPTSTPIATATPSSSGGGGAFGVTGLFFMLLLGAKVNSGIFTRRFFNRLLKR